MQTDCEHSHDNSLDFAYGKTTLMELGTFDLHLIHATTVAPAAASADADAKRARWNEQKKNPAVSKVSCSALILYLLGGQADCEACILAQCA